ncbi:MAG: enoyl-CoA hydratase-related protein, partial [Acidimicrobiia bacterium]
GLVNRLVDDDDLDEATADLAGALAAAPPLAVAASKRLVDAVTEGTTTAEGLAAAGEAQAGCIRSADFTEAIAAFTEKRAPVYTGR